jgi:hypothetical protein
VCSVQCAVCSVQCAVCSVQCAVCSVQCAVCSVQCTCIAMIAVSEPRGVVEILGGRRAMKRPRRSTWMNVGCDAMQPLRCSHYDATHCITRLVALQETAAVHPFAGVEVCTEMGVLGAALIEVGGVVYPSSQLQWTISIVVNKDQYPAAGAGPHAADHPRRAHRLHGRVVPHHPRLLHRVHWREQWS